MRCINACSRSDDPRGKALSNFSAHSFEVDGVQFATVEAFLQGIKFPEDDPRRAEVFAMSGYLAWKMRVHSKAEYVWWNGERIVYNSKAHAALLKRAIEAKFAQNPDALEALKNTRGLEIIHDTGGSGESDKTSLRAVVFCQILTDIRDRALSE